MNGTDVSTLERSQIVQSTRWLSGWTSGRLSRSGRVGLLLLMGIALLALLGPYFRPYSPSEIAGIPFAPPSADHWLGTDFLGRDGLSRFLSGGRTIIGAALAATLLNYLIGVPVGLRMGWKRGLFDGTATGFVDLLIAFPPMIFVLMLIAAAGNSVTAAILALVAVQTPRVIRIVRASTLDVVTREYVEAAVARGESTRAILRKDVLPNITTPLLADMGVRFTGSLILFSAMSYLGLGESPPAANWGLMMSENRLGLLQAPLLIALPAVTIAIAAVGANLVADSIAQRSGRSVTGLDG